MAKLRWLATAIESEARELTEDDRDGLKDAGAAIESGQSMRPKRSTRGLGSRIAVRAPWRLRLSVVVLTALDGLSGSLRAGP